MRDAVEGDVLLEHLRRVRFVPVPLPGLLVELVHPLLPGAARGLVGGNDDAPDGDEVVQRLEGDHHLDRRTVRVGDDVAARRHVEVMGVHLRDDERHIVVVAKARRVVDDHRTGFGRPWRIAAGDLTPG